MDENHNPKRQAVLLMRAQRAADPLDRHHVFGGPYRKKSERYGLTCVSVPQRCYIFGKNAVHNNRAQDLRLKQIGQKAWMEQNGKKRRIYKKNLGGITYEYSLFSWPYRPGFRA